MKSKKTIHGIRLLYASSGDKGRHCASLKFLTCRSVKCLLPHSCSLLLLLQGLRAHGHVVNLGRWSAVTQAIVVDPDHDTLVGASDPRKDGAPDGY